MQLNADPEGIRFWQNIGLFYLTSLTDPIAVELVHEDSFFLPQVIQIVVRICVLLFTHCEMC